MNIFKVQLEKNKLFFGGDKSITLHKNILKNTSFEKYRNKEVFLGIRPNDLKIASKSKSTFPATVIAIENMGSYKEITIFSKMFGLMKIIEKKDFKINQNDDINIEFDPLKIHLFDCENGLSLTSFINPETKKAQDIWLNSHEERIKNQKLLDREKNKKTISAKVANQMGNIFSNKKYIDEVKNSINSFSDQKIKIKEEN